ncbi:MAG TPA: metallopeptidase TldD-related protein [Thermoanaerobaculia bacterium]|nr:metallopeptidase TldD-related protein [Thermoanaerobaculia bacterium]
MPGDELVSLDEMTARLERALASSPADSTEILWIEARRSEVAAGRGRRDGARAPEAAADGGRAGAASAAASSPHRERSLLIRVRQSGRTGLHRTGGAGASDLENAVRDAMAQARLAPATTAEPLPTAAGERAANERPSGERPTGERAAGGDPALAVQGGPDLDGALFDQELAELEAGQARGLLDRAAGRRERLRLAWLEGRVVVANSAGLRRAARVTAASFEVSCGTGAGAGSAAGAARHLSALGIQDLLDRARARHGGAEAGAGPATPAGGAGSAGDAPPPLPWDADAALATAPTLVLSEQSTAALLELLNLHGLSATAQRDAGCCLHGRLGELLFAPCLSLRDDGNDPRALPFPFDLAGWRKRRVDLIVEGVFTTPAVDVQLAQEIGRQPTPHAMAPDESIAANLLLLPGAGEPLAEAELLRQAEDGIWIGALGGLECFDLGRLRFRALALGVRRIAGGVLGPPLPDLVWEDSLLGALARVQTLGDRPVAIAGRDMLFGATAAPLLALRGAERLGVAAR